MTGNGDVLEARELYTNGMLTVRATMKIDGDSTPKDADCYSDADVAAWYADRWMYVGLVVRVEWNGVAIAKDSLWGIEHGDLTEVNADAWALEPALELDDVTYQGSPLAGVVEEALSSAMAFVQSTLRSPGHLMLHPLGRALAEARKWLSAA